MNATEVAAWKAQGELFVGISVVAWVLRRDGLGQSYSG